MKKLTNVIIVFFFIANGVFAQTGTIKGIIKDKKTQQTIPGVTAYVEIGGNMFGGASDVDGKYTISNISNGKHAIYVSAVGYKKIKIFDVPITTDKITFVNIEMEEAITALDGITVVAKMHDVPLIEIDEPGTQHIPMKEFEKSADNDNPILAITTMTTDLTLAPNGKDVYVRGSRPQPTKFITDGMKSITVTM